MSDRTLTELRAHWDAFAELFEARFERATLQLAHSLRDANERLRAISQTDVVTGLANRRQFDEVLKLAPITLVGR